VIDQINLRKKLPSRATPSLEWHRWTTNNFFEWLTQLYRKADSVEVGDIKGGFARRRRCYARSRRS
jgi:hypothetical protein